MEQILYFSTRGDEKRVSAGEAILKGIADDGGLFVPSFIPRFTYPLGELASLSYQELAYEVLKLFLTDFTEDELTNCIREAYSEATFSTEKIAPLAEKDGDYFLELFHGKTLAFKDMALSILPHLMKTAAKKTTTHKKIVILTATSGDTGKAALEAFAYVEGIDIIVFYPLHGVSHVQKMQMTTQEGDNTAVIGIEGNFDDAQAGVKSIFANSEVPGDVVFSSANSINIGRLLPQIVYYFYAYAQLLQKDAIVAGELVNFTVPTGNFGNILAGWYAKKMGLPINKLICASNDNKVLYDFFKTGHYNKNREFVLTESPSMDILLSSNLERLLFHLQNDSHAVKEWMTSLQTDGHYHFNGTTEDFAGVFASGPEMHDAIRKAYRKNYVPDTHTAVAYAAYQKYLLETGDCTKNIFVATASPFKFAEAVYSAIGPGTFEGDAFEATNRLSKLTGLEVPAQIKDLATKEIRHKSDCHPHEMESCVMEIIKRRA